MSGRDIQTSKKIMPSLREFAYLEIINIGKVAVGTCKTVGFPILNNCNSASFGFCNYQLVEIKGVVLS